MSAIKFKINYHTNFGEEVYICGSHPELGNLEISQAKKLTYQDGYWEIDVNINTTGILRYFYLIKDHNRVSRLEWGKTRKIHITKSKDFSINDNWKNKPFHNYLFTSAFSDSIFAHEAKTTNRYYQTSYLINVICPYVKREQELVMVGETDYLGNWDINKAKPLEYSGNGEWQIVLDLKHIKTNTEYKLVIIDSSSKEVVYWEYGNNRVLNIEEDDTDNHVRADIGIQFDYDSFSFKGSGTAIPVFSLRSEDSFGIGDFFDLRKMIDWAAATSQQMIQVLPINDTTTTKTWRDSYPYNAISSYALHPMYLGLGQFPLKGKQANNTFKKEAAELNQLQFLDYEKVLDLKTRYTKQLFEEQGAKTLKTKEYNTFYANNQEWLFPYAIYCHLRDVNNTAHFGSWGKYSVYDKNVLEKLVQENNEAKNSFNYYCFIQYLLDKQLKETTQYAHSKGISLKGDIPIGINRDSIEAWTSPHLFNMDTQTGAPPDDFSIFGQNWGFPTYNWKVMEHENFDWWKKRFQKMADYFDAYRIDHILGFFRIWEIPLHSVQGLLGHFSPAMPYHPEELNMSGIAFDKDRMIKPFIHESFLSNIFGEYTDEVISQYLNVSEWQRFDLKEEYNTQRKIQHHFANLNDDKNTTIRDGLYELCNEVLFVRDRIDHNRFHPRITAHSTYSYQYLDQNTKWAFDRLYEDFFYHRHNYFWSEQAMRKLPALIDSTQMLCCGEDLGMVPDCVPSVMNELKILSLEIQRMPKDINVAFTKLERLPYLSVSTTSTHDMSPIRLWWTENRDVTQYYYNSVLGHHGEAPQECNPQLCDQIIKQHLQSTAMWVILPLQDWMSVSQQLSSTHPEDERINIPSNPQHYWKWRMHITLEELIENVEFNSQVSKLSKRQ